MHTGLDPFLSTDEITNDLKSCLLWPGLWSSLLTLGCQSRPQFTHQALADIELRTGRPARGALLEWETPATVPGWSSFVAPSVIHVALLTLVQEVGAVLQQNAHSRPRNVLINVLL